MNFKKILMQLKFYFDRGRAYISIISFMGTVFMVITQLSLIGIDIDITNYSIIIVVVGFAGIMLFGYLEVKYLFFSHEAEIKTYKNPVWIKLFNRLDEIENKLDKKDKE